MATALIRDDGGPTLTIDGDISMTVSHQGRLTDKAVVDRTFVVDGRIILPKTSTMDIIVPIRSVFPDLKQGQARISEVLDWLQDAKDNARIMTIQRAGWPPLTDMMVETFARTIDYRDSPSFSVSFKESRIARIRSTTLAQAPPRAKKGKPNAKVAAGIDSEKDLGTKPTKEQKISYAKAGLNSTIDFFNGNKTAEKYLSEIQPAWYSYAIPGN